MTAETIDLEALAAKARADLDAATDEAALEAWRVAHLGRKGTLTAVLRQLGGLEMDERVRIGGE
ncbi:MAG: phenylalanine--tRNA ligase subunit alpha, partial [Chloroflexi bacterium]|nr:phenylalanine--tRNA ligase subunit alpha [Chloroflexota bacterium]